VPPTQPPLARPPSHVTLDLGPGALVSFSAAPDQEISIAAGTLNALLDRPVDSGGQRIALQEPALSIRVHTATSITVDIGSVLTPTAKTSLALMAENALIPVGTPNGFLLSGTLSQGRISGGLSIGFPASVIVPTFPDPYAASYSASAGRELLAGVAALVTWRATTPPVLTINPIKTSSLAPAPGLPAMRQPRCRPLRSPAMASGCSMFRATRTNGVSPSARSAARNSPLRVCNCKRPLRHQRVHGARNLLGAGGRRGLRADVSLRVLSRR
jgi:hypothetical protein